MLCACHSLAPILGQLELNSQTAQKRFCGVAAGFVVRGCSALRFGLNRAWGLQVIEVMVMQCLSLCKMPQRLEELPVTEILLLFAESLEQARPESKLTGFPLD